MTDLFDDQNSGGNTPQDAGTEGATSDPLEALVGEGKKFKTPQDLAKSKLEADAFIEQLKSENAEMRSQLEEAMAKVDKGATVADILKQMNQASSKEGNQSQLTSEDIQKLIDSRVEERDVMKTRRANREKALNEVRNKFMGDEAKAKEFIQTEAQRLGLSPKDLGALSETSPQAFARLLGLQSTQRGFGGIPDTKGSLESGATAHGTVRNKSYYDKLKADLGPKFFEPAIQTQRMKDRLALGDKYNT